MPDTRSGILSSIHLDSADDFVGTEAASTDVHVARSTVNQSLNASDVGLESTIGTNVGVRNVDTEINTLAADLTLSHYLHLLSEKKIILSTLNPNGGGGFAVPGADRNRN